MKTLKNKIQIFITAFLFSLSCPLAIAVNTDTSLNWAAFINTDNLKALIDNGADPDTLSAWYDFQGQSIRDQAPLHIAAYYGNIEAIEVLSEAGANLHIQDGIWRRTPLHFAVLGQQKEAIQTLLEIQSIKYTTDKLSIDRYGNTALDIAKKAGYYSIAKILDTDYETPEWWSRYPLVKPVHRYYISPYMGAIGIILR